MIQGILKADGLTLMEVASISFLAGAANPKMHAKAAYVSSTTGATLGAIEHANWSQATLQRLAELKQSMEQDLAAVYFVQHDQAPQALSPKGLLDHLQDGEAPSV